MENAMKTIKLEKITLNCGTSTDAAKLERAVKMLSKISKRKVVKDYARKRLPAFGIRPGLEIGCRVTLRGKEAEELLKRLLESTGNEFPRKQFNDGSFSFGIKEYIEIPGMEYMADVGIMGLEVCVTLTRAGLKIGERKIKRGKVPLRHRITKEETAQFMMEKFGTKITEGSKK